MKIEFLPAPQPRPKYTFTLKDLTETQMIGIAAALSPRPDKLGQDTYEVYDQIVNNLRELGVLGPGERPRDRY